MTPSSLLWRMVIKMVKRELKRVMSKPIISNPRKGSQKGKRTVKIAIKHRQLQAEAKLVNSLGDLRGRYKCLCRAFIKYPVLK